jgi:flagellar hook-associated protein 2
MGTVGLSFGSPTSGQGFDVSSTVASIVGNLQNVETPWKTQLTKLESQDTAISSLGTLFSSLSNDMSSLTDFSGLMAEKEGSSSDQSVLTLTAADSTAVAGTHTVEVANLAQTSSGCLAPIASTSDTLSGAITLQVGTSGTPLKITLNSSDNTLAGLASAINSSAAGIDASVLTDATGSRLSLVSGMSGADGNITVSSNSIVAAASTTLSYTGSAGTSTANSIGSLSAVGGLNDALTGYISIAVGGNAAQTVVIGAAPASPAANTIYTGSGVNTLSALAGAITSAGIGVTASVVTNSDGTSSLSLESETAGAAGTLTVGSNITDPSTALAYASTVTGSNANLTVDGVNLTSASNTVANLIPGVTFQLLAPSSKESDGSLEQIQVVIANDNAQVESTIGQFVSDYNALISAMNTQDGNDSSGNPEPLFGSPTLSLLQEQLLSGLNMQNPNGSLDPVSDSTALNTALSGSMTVTVGSGAAEQIVLGANPDPSSPAANTIYTGSGANTLSGIASAINSADIGFTATVVTSNGESSLSLMSQTVGAAGGTLSVTSNIVASSNTALTYTDDGTDSTEASGSLGLVASSSDTLSGSVSIQVGSGTAQTVMLDSSDNTLTGLMNAINSANIGVSASLTNNNTSISLVSGTSGSAGALTVTSSLYDTTAQTTATLNYTNSSDINSLTGLGVSVNNDGSLTFDATSLDSVLNLDYSGVVGFFQNANSWGQTFSNMLTNAGTSSATGILSLASSSNSNIESTLNADISKEDALISAQQTSLTAELNSANEIMQQLPTQLDGVNELYSAITGYNQNTGG